MDRRSLQAVLTVEERRLVRNWAWATLAFYGSVALIAVTVASFAGQTAAERARDVAKADPPRAFDLDSSR